MLKWLEQIKPAVFIAFCTLFVFQAEKAQSGTDVSYEIADIAVAVAENTISYKITGKTPPIYNVTERFAPFRVVVDVAGAFYGTNLSAEKAQLPQNDVATLQVSDAKDQVPPHMRFEFTLADSHDYAVEKTGNDLLIKLFPAALTKATAMAASAGSGGEAKTKAAPSADSTLDKLIGSSEQLLSQVPDKKTGGKTAKKATTLKEDFSFSGYKKQQISVDFYKIDIHNVFRLFRQITDLNIIVDEDVKGVLTLALTDVPWDFALDIILNLMDLKKEERFNTIVIYPSKKAFVWPTRAEDNLAFEADIKVIEQESLVIEKSATQSKEIMQAKEYMAKAQKLETREQFEEAADLYTKAFELWPDNAKITNRLATLYLVNLGVNAKAVYYAKESLKHDPGNTSAALYAAIGSANMQRIPEAKEYFTQSISNSPPMKEALLSFAAFSENNGQNEAALKLLDKYHSYYGESLDTMVAKARIFDKLARSNEAVRQYEAVLASGFPIRSDLQQYINSRLATRALAAKTLN